MMNTVLNFLILSLGLVAMLAGWLAWEHSHTLGVPNPILTGADVVLLGVGASAILYGVGSLIVETLRNGD
jgi:hypothetical protein